MKLVILVFLQLLFMTIGACGVAYVGYNIPRSSSEKIALAVVGGLFGACVGFLIGKQIAVESMKAVPDSTVSKETDPLRISELKSSIRGPLPTGPAGQNQAESDPQVPSLPSRNLVPCPDCGRMLSKLAISCPQCGRPLQSPPPTTL